MQSFNELGLHPVLATSLKHMKYETPTPIQAQAIPLAMDGRDIMGSAQTGTGKTAAFAIPLIQALLDDERKSALVMTPTRELGKQVMEIMRQLIGPKGKIKTAFLIGGESMHKQTAHLNRRPRLIVGTPGRINDHRERGNLNLDQTSFLVLDETDRMLDMGFSIQIDKIIKYMPRERQTLMFSATMPKNILQMADKYLNNPQRIAVGGSNNTAANIDQKIIRIDQDKKFGALCEELEQRTGSVIVFVKTKRNADRLAKKLSGGAFDAEAIHGDLKQNKRERVIQAYRNQKFRILVGTDVVARGLDVPHVEHVINYDLPQMPEDYIHRIGRTGRAGAKGNSLCLIAPQDGRKWRAIENLIDPDSKDTDGAFGDAKPGKKGGGKRGKGGHKKKPYGAKDNKFGDKRGTFKKDGPKKEGFKKRRRPDGENGQSASGEWKESRRKPVRDDNGGENRKKPAHKKSTKRSRNFSENKGGEFKAAYKTKGKPSAKPNKNGGNQPRRRKAA